MLWPFRTLVALALCCSVTQAIGIWPPAFSRWIWGSSVVSNGLLYLTGGEVYMSNDTGNSHLLASTIAIDLTRDWTTSDPTIAGIVDMDYSSFPFSRKPWVWASDGAAFLSTWGGWYYGSQSVWYAGIQELGMGNASSTPGLWTIPIPFPKTLGTAIPWEYQATPTNIGPSAGGFHANSEDTAYNIGGCIVQDNSYIAPALPGIAQQTLSQSVFNKFTNSSTSGLGPSGYAAWGEAVFVPAYGEEGIIVMLGGYLPGTEYFTWETSTGLQEMSAITIYDIKSGSFNDAKTATGDVPLPRWGFCAVVAEDSSGTGYDIFIHGGYSGPQAPVTQSASAYGNIYVLSLPEYKWTMIANSEQSVRALHTCEVIGQSTMIVVGGANSNTNYGIVTDPFPNAMGLFDMSALAWTTSYNASAAPYTRSPQINDALGSNSTQNSTQPGSPSPKVSSNSTDTGAIAGGVVGGIAAIVLLLGGIWYLRRRRRQRAQSSRRQSPAYEPYLIKSELPADEKPLPSELATEQNAATKGQALASPPTELEGSAPHVHELDSQ